jgi:hypothetical protein
VHEVPSEILATAGGRGSFQAFAHVRIARKADTFGWKGRDNVEIEQDEAPLVYVGREEQLVEFAGAGRIDCGSDIRERVVVLIRYVVLAIACAEAHLLRKSHGRLRRSPGLQGGVRAKHLGDFGQITAQVLQYR